MSDRPPIDRPRLRTAAHLVNQTLRRGGLELRRVGGQESAAPAGEELATPTPTSDPLSTELLRTPDQERADYAVGAQAIIERHRRQNREDIELLRKRYEEPLIGKVRVWELIERLGGCVDPSDERLYCASQLMHVRQILDQMDADGTDTPEMVLVALVHDLGKLLLLTGEDPANVVCMNAAIGDDPEGAGLADALVQWNHDEFAFQRLDGLIPDDLAWLVRFHSLEVESARPLMDATDLDRVDRLLRPFAHYDHATKSPFHLPSTPLSTYRDVIEEAFPDPILF
jgi:hypothetical protein